MRRRDLIAGLAASSLPLAARAQQSGRVYRIGLLVFRASSPASRDTAFGGFIDELGRAGFVEGQNLEIDRRGIAETADDLPQLARAVAAATEIDVIFSTGAAATAAAQKATQTKPIAAIVDDMVASGLVRSMSRPEGNLTGISILATELDGKRQELLFELLPQSRRMMALIDPNAASADHFASLRDTARQRGVELLTYPVARSHDVAAAIEVGRAAGAAAINVLASPVLYSRRKLIQEHGLAAQLGAMYQWPEGVGEGGLIAYGPPFAGVYRQFARQMAKLLKGAAPAGLPIEQPTQFELAINLKTAKALGLTIPPSILARADEVIE